MFKKLSLYTTATIFCLLTFSVCCAQSAKEQISDEINNAEKVLASLPLSADEKAPLVTLLTDAKGALDSDYLYLSLYKLQPVWIDLKSRDYAKAKANIKTVEAFEEEWKRVGVELDKKEKSLKPLLKIKLPAAVIALSEASQVQVRPLHQSGRLYALNTTIDSGFYYLGRSLASIDFALFCRGLKVQNTKPQMKMRSLQTELNQFDKEVVAAYGNSDENQNSSFIRTNVTMKVAFELNKETMYSGALQKYLEANIFYGLISVKSDTKNLSELKTQNEKFKRIFISDDADNSIGQIYWELAQRGLNSDKPNEDDLKRSIIVFEKVLPNYFKYVSGEK